MNKISLHIHQPGMGLDVLDRLRPPLVTVMDADCDLIARMRALFPDMHINVRIAEGDGKSWRNVSPQERAVQILSVIRDCPREKLTVEFFNEPLGHGASQDDKAEYDRRLAEFTHVMSIAGVEVAGLSLAEGNWTKDGPSLAEDFPKSLAVLNYVAIHEYWWSSLYASGMEGYHWRWPYILAQLPSHIKLIISECGLCQAVAGGPDEGWLTGDISVASYGDDLSQYNAFIVQEPRVLGACVFDAWPLGRFGSFRVTDELMERIYTIDAPASPPEQPPEEPPEEPPIEPPEEEPSMDVKVVDLDYQERDFQYAKDKYGVAFRRAEVSPGQKVYRLIELWEKTGNSSLITQVLDEHDKAMRNMDVAFYWPDAPQPPDPPTETYAHDWYKNFIHGPTNENGEVGPGMGRGAYHGKGEGGPHAVWVRDPSIPSDICEKLGMLAGTPHDHLDQIFQLMVEGEQPGEPPTEPSGKGHFEVIAKSWQPQGSNRILVIAQEGTTFYEVRASLLVGDLDMGPFHPVSMTKFDLTTDYVPGEGETSRIYTVVLDRPDGELLSGKEDPDWQCDYFTGTKGWWTLLVEWVEEGGPEPPPPSGELEERVAELEGDMAGIKNVLGLWEEQLVALQGMVIVQKQEMAALKDALRLWLGV